MIKVNLPGNLKYKKVILVVLVILVIGILIKNGVDNNKIKEKEVDNKSNEEIIYNNAEEIKEEKVITKEEELYQEVFGIFHSGEYELAITKANQIIEEFPESYKGYNIRGIAKAFNGDFYEGMSDIDKALEISPEYGYARFNKALNYELYSYYEEALNWYDKALELEEYLWSYYGKASIYGRYGDIDNTVIYLEKALKVAEKEGNKESVIEEARNEADFNPVKDSEKFKSLLE